MLQHYSWKGRLLRKLLAAREALVAQVQGPQPRRDFAAVRETRAHTTLLMQDAAALQLMACVHACRGLGGSMAEAGVFRGGTARLICEARGDAPLHLFDVFETLQGPAPAEASSRAGELSRHFGAVHGRLDEVRRLLAPYAAVHFHPGVFPDSARTLGAERFSFVHVDLDLEPSTRDALEFFFPRLLPGGILVGDNYDDPLVRRTFARYFAGHEATLIELPWGQGMVVKTVPQALRASGRFDA